jgi:DNA-directed RNA polymerase specialized sigma24 family protein
VFVAHELKGRSFKEMAAETGVSVNTLHILTTFSRGCHIAPVSIRCG